MKDKPRPPDAQSRGGHRDLDRTMEVPVQDVRVFDARSADAGFARSFDRVRARSGFEAMLWSWSGSV
jgi:hypothetical protein